MRNLTRSEKLEAQYRMKRLIRVKLKGGVRLLFGLPCQCMIDKGLRERRGRGEGERGGGGGEEEGGDTTV